MANNIHLQVLEPDAKVIDREGVTAVTVDTANGSLGLLPRRLDCVSGLVPGILVYRTETGEEGFVALDEGLLVKEGYEVRISVRQAVEGNDLASLQRTVEEEFCQHSEQEQQLRFALAKLETAVTRHLIEFSRE